MTVTLIGAGNVGFHLGKRLFQKGISVHEVFSRNIGKAEELASQIQAKAINDLQLISSKSDVYIIAVSDDAIQNVAAQLGVLDRLARKLIVHTSGASSSDLVGRYFKRYGVFYPLQTFSKDRKVTFSKIPICIYAGRKKELKVLRKLGKKISKKVTKVTDFERGILHIAAVFVNNFSNHLFHIGQEIVDEQNIDFNLLKPLILETVLKIENAPPLEMQTGPARRNDQKTIKKHLKYLKKFPQYAQIYTFLTKNITNAYRR